MALHQDCIYLVVLAKRIYCTTLFPAGKTGDWLGHHKVWAALIPVLVIAAFVAAATAAVWVQERVAQNWARLLDRVEQPSELVQVIILNYGST